MKKALLFLIFSCALVIGCGMTSCNVTRRTTVESVYTQKGDTSVNITTKTIETYDARKHLAQ